MEIGDIIGKCGTLRSSAIKISIYLLASQRSGRDMHRSKLEMCFVSTNGERACPVRGFQRVGYNFLTIIDSMPEHFLNIKYWVISVYNVYYTFMHLLLAHRPLVDRYSHLFMTGHTIFILNKAEITLLRTYS